jgi:gliding motility-associated-like protein
MQNRVRQEDQAVFVPGAPASLLFSFAVPMRPLHIHYIARLAAPVLVLMFAAALRAPAQGCSGAILYKEDFGGGPSSPNVGPALADSVTSYSYTAQDPIQDGQYSIRKKATSYNVWHEATDHTGSGYMMVVNASYDAGLFYQTRITGLCQGSSFYFSAWVANLIIKGASDPLDPNLRFEIRRASDSGLIAENTTGLIPRSAQTQWRQYGIPFKLPPGESSVILQIYNNQKGGSGNDLVLDDITFSLCGPAVSLASEGTYEEGSDVCAGEAVSLKANVGDDYYSDPTYQWQFSTDTLSWKDVSGATTTALAVPAAARADSGWYRILVAENGNIGLDHCRISSDALKLAVWPSQPFAISTNSPVCQGAELRLSAAGGIAYEWEGPAGFTSSLDSLVFRPAQPSESGSYRLVRTTRGGCVTSAQTTASVQANDLTVVLPRDTLFCQGTAVWLQVANPGATYLWSTGEKTPIVAIDTPGVFTVTVTQGICRESDTTRIGEVLRPAVSLGADTALCFGEAYTLDVADTSAEDYLWNDGSTAPVHAVSEAGAYWVTLTGHCGTASDTIHVTLEDCANELLFPTAFTPNGDGKNDVFGPRIFLRIGAYSLCVFDRWGRRIFQSRDPAHRWDGRERGGTAAPVGAYLWIARYTVLSDHQPVVQRGTVTLLR